MRASAAAIARRGQSVPVRRSLVIGVRNFPETTLSALVVELDPGAMRELHWHPDADEWQYYLAGEARMTVGSNFGRGLSGSLLPSP